MSPAFGTGILHALANGAAPAARTFDAVANNANGNHAEVIPFRTNTNGANPFVVGLTTLWWAPVPHERSVTPLSTGGSVTWAL